MLALCVCFIIGMIRTRCFYVHYTFAHSLMMEMQYSVEGISKTNVSKC